MLEIFQWYSVVCMCFGFYFLLSLASNEGVPEEFKDRVLFIIIVIFTSILWPIYVFQVIWEKLDSSAR